MNTECQSNELKVDSLAVLKRKGPGAIIKKKS